MKKIRLLSDENISEPDFNEKYNKFQQQVAKEMNADFYPNKPIIDYSKKEILLSGIKFEGERVDFGLKSCELYLAYMGAPVDRSFKKLELLAREQGFSIDVIELED